MGNIESGSKGFIDEIIKHFAGSMSQQKDIPSLTKIGNALNAPQTRSVTADLNTAKGSLVKSFTDAGGWKSIQSGGMSTVGEIGKNTLKDLGPTNLAGLGVSLAGAAVGKADYGGGANKLLTGAGSLIGGPAGIALQAAAVANSALGSTSGKTGNLKKVVAPTGSGFMGAEQQYNESKARDENKKTTLLGNLFKKKKVLSTSSNNERIQKNVNTQTAIHKIGEEHRKKSMASDYNTAARDSAYQNKMTGLDNKYTITAKLGTKLPDLSKNVIPSGALHARKHNLEIEGEITNKGIPVISYEEDGEIKQHAEIEVNEIVLRKEATEYLEELEEKYRTSEDKKEKIQLAIEAGKYFTEELMENTNDNTGLIEKV